MYLFMILHSVFGLLIGIRIYKGLCKKQIYNKTTLTKIGTGFLALNLLNVIFFITNAVLFLFFLYFPLICVVFAQKTLEFKRRSQFKNQFPMFLNQIILQIHLGHSFRRSVETAKLSFSRNYQLNIDKIMENVVFSQQSKFVVKDIFINQIIDFFKKVDRVPHQSVDWLIFFRQKLHLEKNFRHKSKQITLQLRLQVLVLGVLYVALFIFVVLKYGFLNNLSLFLVSILFFLMGIIVFVQLIRGSLSRN